MFGARVVHFERASEWDQASGSTWEIGTMHAI
jgi:hypothetical protein